MKSLTISKIIRSLKTRVPQAVLDIYNHYVMATPCTLAERKDRFDNFEPPDATGRGLGTRIYQPWLTMFAVPHHRAYAAITRPNPASVALHAKFGFELIGSMSQAGYKFNRFWDVAWYEKKLKQLPE